jgi:hypothetical protein
LLQTNPCAAVFEYTETKHGTTRILKSDCLTCGKDTGTHLLKSQEELRFWYDTVITIEDAKVQLKEYEDCHRAGISYDAFMGFRYGGDEMTPEEYIAVTNALLRLVVPCA